MLLDEGAGTESRVDILAGDKGGMGGDGVGNCKRREGYQEDETRLHNAKRREQDADPGDGFQARSVTAVLWPPSSDAMTGVAIALASTSRLTYTC